MFALNDRELTNNPRRLSVPLHTLLIPFGIPITDLVAGNRALEYFLGLQDPHRITLAEPVGNGSGNKRKDPTWLATDSVFCGTQAAAAPFQTKLALASQCAKTVHQDLSLGGRQPKVNGA